jgi:hypothetical protein
MDSIIDSVIGSEGIEYDMAKLLVFIYKDKYRYEPNKKKWYLRNDDNNEIDLNSNFIIIRDLRKDLSENLCKRFMERGIYYMNMMVTTSDEGQKEVYSKKASAASKISLKLKQDGYKSRILKELSYMLI